MALTLRIVGSLGESLANRKLDPADYFRVARNPSRIDAKRRDHFPQADLPGARQML